MCGLILSNVNQRQSSWSWIRGRDLSHNRMRSSAPPVVNIRATASDTCLLTLFKGTLHIYHVSFKCQNTENLRLTGYKLYTRWMRPSLTSTRGCRALRQEKKKKTVDTFCCLCCSSIPLTRCLTHTHTHTHTHTVQHTSNSCLSSPRTHLEKHTLPPLSGRHCELQLIWKRDILMMVIS